MPSAVAISLSRMASRLSMSSAKPFGFSRCRRDPEFELVVRVRLTFAPCSAPHSLAHRFRHIYMDTRGGILRAQAEIGEKN